MRAARRGILGTALGCGERGRKHRARIAASRAHALGGCRAGSHKIFLRAAKAPFAARDVCVQFAAQTWQDERVARAHRLVAHAWRAHTVSAFAAHDATSGEERSFDFRNVPQLLESR